MKGKGFRGALEYDLRKAKGRVIETNMAGQSPRALATEFGEIRGLRPNLGRAVVHVSLSAAPGEALTDVQWRAIGRRYLRGMGFDDNQFVITWHTDTEHGHIHILANRIKHSGEVVSEGRDYKRQEALMREIERDYGLRQVAPSLEAERRTPTKGEIEHGIRTGQPSTRQQLQQLCGARGLRLSQLHRVPGAAGGCRGGAGAGGAAQRREALRPVLPTGRRDHEGQRLGTGVQPRRAGKTGSHL